MGCGSWTTSSWDTYAKSTGVDHVTASTVHSYYRENRLLDELNPIKFSIRESRDNEEHPNSTPILIGLDVTGSMSPVLAEVVKSLNTLITETYNRKPVSDPQIAFMGIGDYFYDESPIQITQFESDIRIAESLKKIYYERCGGSNDSEGYIGSWYYAANHIVTDSFTKRNKKGYIFTIGDECVTPKLTKNQIKKFIGDDIQVDEFTPEELLNSVSREWEVFHLMIEQGNYMTRHNHDRVINEWTSLLGQNAILVNDYTKIAEIIVSTLQAMSGESVETIVNSWDGSTKIAVQKAISGIEKTDTSSNLIKF